MRSILAIATLCIVFVGCSSPPAKTADNPMEVTRTEEEIDLSGDWNDVDADKVAAALIKDCLSFPWAEEWKVAHGRKPVVRLYPIRNKTDAYINYLYFTKQVEIALIRSGRVDVVSSKEEADVVREEKADQAKHASDESVKTQGNETGSDYILNGWILSQNDQAGNKEVRTYLTTMELTEVETQKKAWAGQQRIKKLLKRAE